MTAPDQSLAPLLFWTRGHLLAISRVRNGVRMVCGCGTEGGLRYGKGKLGQVALDHRMHLTDVARERRRQGLGTFQDPKGAV